MGRDLQQTTTEEIYHELQRRDKIELTKSILLALATGTALTAGIVIAPNLTSYLCRLLFKKTKNRYFITKQYMVKRTLNRLRQQSLIDYQENRDGKVTLTLTEAGQLKVLRYKFDEMVIKKPKRWDRKWRMVIFDVPEGHKAARDALRDKMKSLGLYQLQKSVWISPYPCKNEVDFISHLYGIGRYLLYFETKKLENEQFLINNFNLF